MARKETGYKLSPDELWGPENYKSCYVREDHPHITEHVHYIKYEVLNHTSPNHMQLEINYDAWLFFRVKVVAADYRYACVSGKTLHTKFLGNIK